MGLCGSSQSEEVVFTESNDQDKATLQRTVDYLSGSPLSLKYLESFQKSSSKVDAKLPVAELKKQFDMLDADRDGFISKQELTDMLKAIADTDDQNHLTAEQIAEIVTAVDIDGDGKIDFGDFISRGEKLPIYTVYYWGPHPGTLFFGRAAGIYATLNEAGIEYEKKPTPDMPKGGFAVPAVTLPSGQNLFQTIAILNVLGEQLGLNGSTSEEKAFCLQYMMDLEDMFAESYRGDWNKEEVGQDRANAWFALLESRLTDRKFLVKDTPTVADFHGVFVFEIIGKKYTAGDFSAFPNLTQWWADIRTVPSVAVMYDTVKNTPGFLGMMPNV